MNRRRGAQAGVALDAAGEPVGAVALSVAESFGLADVGRHTYGDPEVYFWPGPKPRVRIGKYCSIAGSARLLAGGHHKLDWVTTYPLRIQFGLPGAFADGQQEGRGGISIGHDVWIGEFVTVLDGVSVGHGAVLGAGAVVAKDVRPYAIVVGNPAREIRRRFDDATCERLLGLEWWDWSDAEVVRFADQLSSAPRDVLDALGSQGDGVADDA